MFFALKLEFLWLSMVLQSSKSFYCTSLLEQSHSRLTFRLCHNLKPAPLRRQNQKMFNHYNKKRAAAANQTWDGWCCQGTENSLRARFKSEKKAFTGGAAATQTGLSHLPTVFWSTQEVSANHLYLAGASATPRQVFKGNLSLIHHAAKLRWLHTAPATAR